MSGPLLAAARRAGEPGLAVVAELVASRLGGACVVYLRSEVREALVPVAAHSADPALASQLEEFVGAPASFTSVRLMRALTTGASTLLSGSPAQIDAWLGAPNRRHATRTGLCSLIAVPVDEPGAGIVGAFVVGRHGAPRFALTDRDAVRAVAASTAATFDRERLAWELRERAESASRTAKELSLARRRFTAAFHDSPVGLGLFTLGPGPAQLIDANAKLATLLKTTTEALRHHPSPADFVHADDIPRGLAAMERLLDGELDMVTVEQRALPASGPERLIELTLSLIRDDAGEPKYGLVQTVDVTDARRDETQLARHVRCQGVLAAIGRHALDGRSWAELVDTALPALKGALDAAEAAVLVRTAAGGAASFRGASALSLADALPCEPVLLDARRMPRSWLARGARRAFVAPIGGGEQPRAWLALLGRDEGLGEAPELAFVEAAAHLLAAAEERRAAAEASRRRATRDALTGLPNRALFADSVAHAADRAARDGTALAVVCIDVDRFKDVNETFGHATGDALIRALADQLHGALRADDTLARIGGDEFGVLCESVGDERGAIASVRRLLATFDSPVVIDERSLHVSASFGVAVALDVTGSGAVVAERLLRDADTAMHRAKERHGTTFELFDRAMRKRIVERLRLEQDLRRALEEDQFVLHYQPLVSLQQRRIVGVEALVRWQHPERGMVSPADFIPVAEQTGLIVPLGRWVLNEACRQLAAWQTIGGVDPIYVSVNLSGRQLVVAGLADEIEETLRRTGIPPNQLALELTESVLMEDTSSPAAVLQSLHALGVQLLLDDFGTGYSSLNYVKRFPLHGLKIDRSFIAGIPDDEGDRAMLRAISSMAAALDLAVLAEGVETLEQASWLADSDCDVAQGFGLARPAPAETIEPLLRHGLPPDRLAWSLHPPQAMSTAAGPASATPAATVPLSEAAEALGISASTLRRWANTGRITAIRTPGGHRRFSVPEVRRLSTRTGTNPRGQLRTVGLPTRPLPSVIELVNARPELLAAAAASIYAPGRSGWFVSEASAVPIAQWLDAILTACRTGRFEPALDATARLLAQAEYAGTSLLERCVFIERCRDVVLRQLRDQRIPDSELIDARRIAIRLTQVAVLDRADGR